VGIGLALCAALRHDTQHVEGKLFLGGLDLQSTKDSVHAYCSQW
jgi:hypothetical protein